MIILYHHIIPESKVFIRQPGGLILEEKIIKAPCISFVEMGILVFSEKYPIIF